jgi:hypothetical protein
MTVACRLVEERLPSAEGRLPARLAGHAARCLKCQAEIGRYRRLHRALADLGRDMTPAPPDLAQAVADRLGEAAHHPASPATQLRSAATAAGAMAAAAGTVIVVRWMRTRSAA